MTKKDYVLLAGAISETRAATQTSDLIGPDGALNILVAKLITRLKAENSSFNQSVFVEASR